MVSPAQFDGYILESRAANREMRTALQVNHKDSSQGQVTADKTRFSSRCASCGNPAVNMFEKEIKLEERQKLANRLEFLVKISTPGRLIVTFTAP